MQSEKNSRFDTRELKARLIKKVGQERFDRYFHCLNRFVNQKLSKSEFDKSCHRILGRENLSLHNQMIKAILKNAFNGKVPPLRSHEVGPGSKVAPMSSRNCRSENDATDIKDKEKVDHASRMKFLRKHLIAPLGIPSCSASSSGPREELLVKNIGNELDDNETLTRRMGQIAAAKGLAVSLDCPKTLNNMVDVYLKRLIHSGLDLVNSRSTSSGTSRYPSQKQQIHSKPINGLWPNSQTVSLRDFKVALELNPQLLGENWPSLLEKISMKGFTEYDDV